VGRNSKERIIMEFIKHIKSYGIKFDVYDEETREINFCDIDGDSILSIYKYTVDNISFEVAYGDYETVFRHSLHADEADALGRILLNEETRRKLEKIESDENET
jgi:hypothetical protein